MKTFIRCIFGFIIIAAAWALVICGVYGASNRMAILSGLGFLLMILIAMYIVEPTFINRRIYGAYVCIISHKIIRKYCSGMKLLGEDISRNFKRNMLKDLTGCSSYRELYTYASCEEYFRR